MGLSISKASRACVIVVITGGLSLAAVFFTHSVAQAESWCVTVDGSDECFPTFAACKQAHPNGDCVRGP